MPNHPDGTTCTTISTCREPAVQLVTARGPLRAAPKVALPDLDVYVCDRHGEAARGLVRGRTTIAVTDMPNVQPALFERP